MNSYRIKSLDSLRGIASFVVVIFHCLLSYNLFYYANYEQTYENIYVKVFSITPLHTIWAGKEAVLLFFILSGFVLAIPFLNNNKSFSYSAYITKRFFRIYIPYIVAMIFSTILVMVFADFKNIEGLSLSYINRWDHEVSWKAIISFIFMIEHDSANINGVVWTLFHEMRISFIFPLFLFLLIKFNFLKSLAFSVGINLFFFVTLTLMFRWVHNEYLLSFLSSWRDTFYYSTYFVFGALLYKYKGYLNPIQKLTAIKKWLLFLIALLLINCKWLTLFIEITDYRVEDFISVLGILLLFSLVLTSQGLDIFLTQPILLWLGKISYSLYLVHIPVLMLTTIFMSKIIPLDMAFILVPVFSVLVAHIFNKYVERPSGDLGRSLSKKIPSKIKHFRKIA